MTGVVIVIFVLWGEEAQSYTELRVSHMNLSTLEQNRVTVVNQSKGFEFHIVELKSSRGYDFSFATFSESREDYCGKFTALTDSSAGVSRLSSFRD